MIQGDSKGTWVYAIVESGADGTWKPISLEHELPANLPDNRAALLGRMTYGTIKYGIEEFYIPEAQRDRIADDLSRNVDKARVEIKVDRGGHAALERLRIDDRIYE
jgi:uncharacterized membrane-anchored protein